MCSARMLCIRSGAGADLSSEPGTFSARLGVLDLTGVTGTLEASTLTGEIKLRAGTASFVPVGADGFSRVPQTGGPLLAMWSFERIFIPSTVQLKPAPDSTDAVPVLAATGELTLEGVIDWRGYGGLRGAAGMPGADKSSGVASGGGGGMGDGGGGGGGYSDAGKLGLGTGGGAGGLAYGAPDLVPVHVGAGGGGGGNDGGVGGAGGGAVALLSLGTMSIKSLIDVSGNPGVSGGPSGGGGGGGAGGSIFLSAAQVRLQAGHELRARGGTGGSGSAMGFAGGDGAPGRVWVGGVLTVDGSSLIEPPATLADAPVASFPSR